MKGHLLHVSKNYSHLLSSILAACPCDSNSQGRSSHYPDRLNERKVVGMSNRRTYSGFSIEEVLELLQTAAAGEAWKQFLDGYAPTIMHVVSQYEYDPGQRDDCYLFACEKLIDNGFSRLLSYQPESSASFRNWLNIVIANLCIDWKRQKHGRARPFKAIAKLSRLDQAVFKYKFEQGLRFRTCLYSLQAQFPGLTEPQLAGAVSRINDTLTPRQHWLLSTRHVETVSLDGPELSSPDKQPLDPGDSPEAAAEISQNHARLQQALAELSPQQRLLIKLRYQQDLSLKEVAYLTRLGDPFRARRYIQSALDELARRLKT